MLKPSSSEMVGKIWFSAHDSFVNFVWIYNAIRNKLNFENIFNLTAGFCEILHNKFKMYDILKFYADT